MLLYLLLVMGIQGMVMTRDLFNLFVFLEIVSIATYGLLACGIRPQRSRRRSNSHGDGPGLDLLPDRHRCCFMPLQASLTSTTWSQTQLHHRPDRFAALVFLLACLLRLKPFPANGWGLDVYETARGDVAAMISSGVSAGVLFALLKLLPLFEDQLDLIAVLGAVTFVFSNLIGLRQRRHNAFLGYSSVGQIALLTIAASLLYRLDAEDDALVVGGLFVNHLFAKVGLFWLAVYVGKERLQDWGISPEAGRDPSFGILIVAISGLPRSPASGRNGNWS